MGKRMTRFNVCQYCYKRCSARGEVYRCDAFEFKDGTENKIIELENRIRKLEEKRDGN